jgi:hypothetical protein
MMRAAILAWLGRRLAEGASAALVSHELEPFAGFPSRTLDMEGLLPGAVEGLSAPV